MVVVVVAVVVVVVAAAAAAGVVAVVAAAAAGYLTSTAHLTSESLPPAVQEANEHSYIIQKYIFNIAPDLSPKNELLSPTRQKLSPNDILICSGSSSYTMLSRTFRSTTTYISIILNSPSYSYINERLLK